MHESVHTRAATVLGSQIQSLLELFTEIILLFTRYEAIQLANMLTFKMRLVEIVSQ